jgi:hypothetical protein
MRLISAVCRGWYGFCSHKRTITAAGIVTNGALCTHFHNEISKTLTNLLVAGDEFIPWQTAGDIPIINSDLNIFYCKSDH